MSPAYCIEQDFCEDCQRDAIGRLWKGCVDWDARREAAKKDGKQCLLMESRGGDPYEEVTLCLECLERRVAYLRDGIKLLQSETNP